MSLELSARFVAQDYCRLCLSSIYELHALFPKGPTETNAVLMSKISLLAEIILIPTEELNARICSRCIQQLEDFDSFRRRCKDSDSQIRKIRALQKWNDPPGNSSKENAGTNKNTPTEGQQQQVKFGGIFDLMLYSEYYPAALGEYYMLFDGCVYRKESLLVWRCELPNCPCQLLVENIFSKFWIYGTHNHAKLSSDQRKFRKMDQRICAFLNKLRDQMDGVIEIQDRGAGSVGVSQMSPSKAQKSVPSDSETVEIQYSTEGDKPSILVNFQKYYKEAVDSDIVPSQIYWRCSDKNCLGMIITTADLGSYRVYKDHNHVAKPVTDRTSSIQTDFPLRVAALPMSQTRPSESATAQVQNQITRASPARVVNVLPASQSMLPENTPKAKETCEKRTVIDVRLSATKQIETNGTTACARSVPLSNNQALMTFYKDSKNYYMFLFLFLYHREVCYSSPTNSEVLWKCTAAKCPGTMIVFPNLKFAPGLAHNHGPISISMLHLVKVPPAEALTKPPVVSEISFFRCSTNEICLLYKQFIYGILSFLSTDAIVWTCINVGCSGQLRSGMQFEYLTTVKDHNHGPLLERTVDVERHLSVSEALKMLQEKRQKIAVKVSGPQLQERIEKRIAAELRTTRSQKALKQRRKSTWC